MGLKLPPRNEAQFRDEIRAGLNKAFPGLVLFHVKHSVNGEPDCHIVINKFDMHVEFKYMRRAPNSLEQVWNLLREIQKVTMLNMAAKGLNVFLVVCIDGKEAFWFIFHHAQVAKAVQQNAPKWTCLALTWRSLRDSEGNWRSGRDWGEEHEPTVSLVDHLLSRLRKSFNGLTKL